MTSSSAPFDTIVIGGGHNGLVCAAMLGQSGRKVLVLEAGAATGGAARTEEFHPGFRASTAHLLNRLHPEVIRALGLKLDSFSTLQPYETPTPTLPGRATGLARPTDPHQGEGGATVSEYPSPLRGGVRGGGIHKTPTGAGIRKDATGEGDTPTILLSPTQSPLILHGAWGETIEGDISDTERQAFAAMLAQLIRFAGVLKPFLARRPPDLTGMDLSEKLGLGGAALSLRRLGTEDMRDFLRMLLMNVHDVAEEHLTDDRLKGLLAFDATLGSHLGPRSPTSLLGLYYRLAGETGGKAGAQMLPAGGMGAVVAAIEAAAARAGVTVRTDAPVTRILVENGRAVGVQLDDGSELRAQTIVSAINPRTTFLDLVGPSELDTGVVRKAQNIRMAGDVAKLHLALDRVPEFTGVPATALRGRLLIAPSSEQVERAFNPAKYGAFSPEPVMEITLPSLSDPALAPDGACVLSAVVQYAPYALKEGWARGKPKFLKAILAVLERQAPGIGKSIRHAELLTPADIEARYLMPGGHWHHGELQADQMLMSRPFFGAEGYATAIDGLWLAGAGSHPGGGVSGAPGMNAARAILKGRG
ncbi:MAG: NAD(P)/FAD-dependent oxidoreductase [Mesorhizobium sp.]|nr:NAD(P)/FAD-dependent oxidoreductase [Mesorhizobium sp.]